MPENHSPYYTIQDLRKITNCIVKEYESEFGKPDKIINTIYYDVHGYNKLINQCRIYLNYEYLFFITEKYFYIIPFDKITGYEVVDLKNQTNLCSASVLNTTTDTGDIIKRAVIGGVLAGGVGAMIGGTTAKTHTSQESNMFDYLNYLPDIEIKIQVDNILTPLIKIRFEEFKENAEEVIYTLNAIIKRNSEKSKKDNTKIVLNEINIEEIGNSLGFTSYDPFKEIDKYKESEEYKTLTGNGTDLASVVGVILVVLIIFFLVKLVF